MIIMTKRIMTWMLAAIFILCGTMNVQAQAMKAADLEKYAKSKYGDKWLDAAANLASGLTLDKNESLTYQQVIDAPGKTKQQLYVALNYWATATFKDKQAITLNDKEAGCIIISSTIDAIADHTGTLFRYVVSITPVIKLDIKDGKVRITYTVQNYDVLRVEDGGWLGGLGSDNDKQKDQNIYSDGKRMKAEPSALRRAVGDSQALSLRGERRSEAYLLEGTRNDSCLLERHHRQGGRSHQERNHWC